LLSQKLLFILLGPVGLDWSKLKETLNPEFDWETAVQATLKTDDSLDDVRYIFTYYLVTLLLAGLFKLYLLLIMIYNWIYDNGVNEKCGFV